MGTLKTQRLALLTLVSGLLLLTFVPPLAADNGQGQVAIVPTPAFHLTNSANGGIVCPHQFLPFAHWPLREFGNCEITLKLNPAIPGGINPPAAAAVRTAVQAAVNTWNNLQPAVVKLKLDPADSNCQSWASDGTNCIYFTLFAAGQTSKPGQTKQTTDGKGRILDADIRLNTRPTNPIGGAPQAWTATPNCPGAPKYPLSIRAVVLHELGHFLGLDHPNQTSCPGECDAHDSTNQTVMHSLYNNACEHELHQADKDGGNFLYTSDLGDAEDKPYPTLLHSNSKAGPEHLFGIHTDPTDQTLPKPRYQYEWLGLDGGIIDDSPEECEARVTDNDKYDDGVEIAAKCDDNNKIKGRVKLRIGVRTAADLLGKKHKYTGSNRMYVNGWFDWNSNGVFEKSERVVRLPVREGKVYPRSISAKKDKSCDVQSRFRLDYRENVGDKKRVDKSLKWEKGAAQFGEVEDYVGLTRRIGGGGNPPPPPPPPVTPPPPTYCHEAVIPVTGGGYLVGKLDAPCHEPQGPTTGGPPSPGPFTLGGSECFDTAATTGIDYDNDGEVDEDIAFTGPTCVTRSDPYVGEHGRNRIDTTMTRFELHGESEVFGPITLRAVPGYPILGQIEQSQGAQDAGYDVGPLHPAESYFDVYFVIEGDFGVTDITGPVRVEAELAAVPPVPPNPDIEPTDPDVMPVNLGEL